MSNGIFIGEWITHHWLWDDSMRLKRWIDLLFLADESGRVRIDANELSKRWDVSRLAVTKFLRSLAGHGLIEPTAQSKSCVVTVVGFGRYSCALDTVMDVGIKDEIGVSPDFKFWWDAYDKKVGREACLKKWSRLKESEKIACMRATPEYVVSTPDKKYRKNPLTYLNQKAWNDEIINEDGRDKIIQGNCSGGNWKDARQRERIESYARVAADFRKQSELD